MSIYTKDMQKYIASEEWEIRKNKLLDFNDKCLICGSRENLVAHHNTYEHFGNEQRGDLELVCKSCHKKIHNNRLVDMRRVLIVKTNFILKNNLGTPKNTRRKLENILEHQKFFNRNKFINNFVFINLDELYKLDTKYQINLYLYLLTILRGKTGNIQISIEKLRDILARHSSVDNNNFVHRFVMKPAKEINNKENVSISTKLNRQGENIHIKVERKKWNGNNKERKDI